MPILASKIPSNYAADTGRGWVGKRMLPKCEPEYDIEAMGEAWGGAGMLYTFLTVSTRNTAKCVGKVHVILLC